MSRFEITNYQYAMFVQDTGHTPPADWESVSYPEDQAYIPVTNVSWYDAYAFSEWLARKTGLDVRLPTEAQWERVARLGGLYPWGDDFDPDGANLYTAGMGEKARIGSFPGDVNPLNIMDLGGNVREWMWDNYSMLAYAIAPKVNPQGPPSGQKRVLRGGSYKSIREAAVSTHRDSLDPSKSLEDLGIRLVIQSR